MPQEVYSMPMASRSASAPSRALDVGIRLFRECFHVNLGPNDRLWIRGVISRSTDSELVQQHQLKDWPRIVSSRPTPSTLRATIDEHSGFRGMRLLVHEELLENRD